MAGPLSGCEAQRTMIRHLGSSLTDVTYVFDERARPKVLVAAKSSLTAEHLSHVA